MKILMVCDFFDEKLSYQENLLAKYYRKDGHEVVIITSMHDQLFAFSQDGKAEGLKGLVHDEVGFRVYRQPYSINIFNRVRSYAGVSEILKDERPDLLFMHDISLNLLDFARYKKLNPSVPLLFDYHADYSNSGKDMVSRALLHGVIRRAIFAYARPQIDRILPVVPESAVFLHDLYGVKYEEMELLPLGFDTDAVEAVRAGPARKQLRQRYGIDDNHVVIFTGGKFNRLKCTIDLIEAFEQNASPATKLVIVGADVPGGSEYGRNLMARAKALPNVILTGWLSAESTYEHMAMADLAVFPSSQSVLWQQCIGMGLPLVLGRRVASTKRLQDAHYLNQNGNVLILDPSKPLVSELCAALDRLCNDSGLREEMSKGARKTATDFLSWDKLARTTLTKQMGQLTEIKIENEI